MEDDEIERWKRMSDDEIREAIRADLTLDYLVA
jgi:hypothetical protein